ncbi:MAG: hypothetical protein ACERKD_24355 [Prolixibacteraceae bacterium]
MLELLGGLCMVIACDPDNSVLGKVAYAWAGFGVTFGPLLMLSFYLKRLTTAGAIASMFGGAVTVLI